MTESSTNGRKTLWEKEKLLFTSNFSFSPSVFRRLVLQTGKNQGLFRKEFKRDGGDVTSIFFFSRTVFSKAFSASVVKTRNCLANYYSAKNDSREFQSGTYKEKTNHTDRAKTI